MKRRVNTHLTIVADATVTARVSVRDGSPADVLEKLPADLSRLPWKIQSVRVSRRPRKAS